MENVFGVYDHATGFYSGAIGLLQRNQTDFLATTVFLPHLIDPDCKYFDYSMPVSTSTLAIASVYNYTEEKVGEKDLMDGIITGFGVEFLVAAIASFLLFVFLLQVGQRILFKRGHGHFIDHKYQGSKWGQVAARSLMNRRNEKRSPFWLVARAFLLEDNFPETDFFHKLFGLVVSVYLFFFLCYVLNNVSTDMVVTKDPQTIGSYQDILDRPDVEILWPSVLPDYELFKESPEGSIEHKLFKKALVTESGLAGALSEKLKFINRYKQQTLVTILRDSFLYMMSSILFTLGTKMNHEGLGEMRLLVRTDPNAKEVTNALVVGKAIDPFVKRAIFKRCNE